MLGVKVGAAVVVLVQHPAVPLLVNRDKLALLVEAI
jgi:hypothetical protein